MLILAGGLSVLLGIWADLGALALVVFLVPTALIIARLLEGDDPQAKQMEMVQFQKVLGLAGAALIIFAFFAYAGDDLGLTITGPAVNLD